MHKVKEKTNPCSSSWWQSGQNETATVFPPQFEYAMITTKACKKYISAFSALNMANQLAICGYMKWMIISVVLCTPDLRVRDLFLEPPVKQRLPLVILTHSQSNQPEWWRGGHMLITIIILTIVEQKDTGFVVVCYCSHSKCVCAPVWDLYLYSCKCTQCTNDSERSSPSHCVFCVCVCLHSENVWIMTE